MSEQPQGEKQFAPTAKRKQDAAKKGDVLRSKELATAAAILVGAVWLLGAGPWLLEALANSLRASFQWDRQAIDDFAPAKLMLPVLIAVLPPVLLLGLAVLGASLVSQLGFGSGRWVPANLAFKGSRINPLSGLKRMFGPNGLIEMGKGILKVILLGGLAVAWGWNRVEALAGVGGGNLSAQLSFAWQSLVTLLFVLTAGLFVIAFVDVPVQWLRQMKRLKMTHQEMRDEHKETDGSPERKAAIRDRQRKLAMGALAPAMREAQFVITNPTHFSVAMAYDPLKGAAPIVVAKGRGEKALAIRELAAELGVPMLEYPALARSVYFTTRERQVIREELYMAVAAVLAFVLALQRGEARERPDIEVPLAMRFDAEGRPAQVP
ncbi:MAG: flagellar type III secretion system protein FlhB [Sphingomonadaceae bacterium]